MSNPVKESPNYLVQTADKTLHAYWRLDILLCELTVNSGEEVTVFQAIKGWTLRYEPVTIEALRAKAES